MKKIKLIALGGVLLALFMAPSVSYGGTYIGIYCFKLDNYDDTWGWAIEQIVANSVYSVTGLNLTYNGAMNGGGAVAGSNHLRLSVTETDSDNGDRAIYAIDLNLATLKGTVDFAWIDLNNTAYLTFTKEPFSNVSCGAAATILEPIVKGDKR